MNTRQVLLSSCFLLLAIAPLALAQDARAPRIPIKEIPWDGIAKQFQTSEIVVIGLVDSWEINDPEGDGRDVSTPGRKLHHYLRKLRELGNQAIPGLDGKALYSDKISIFAVESNEAGAPANVEAHKEKARSLYTMLEAQPYVMSNPVVILIHQGKLVRCYGSYHEPGPEGISLQRLVVTLLSPENTDQPLLPEIVMMKTLALRKDKGDKEAIAYFADQFQGKANTSGFYSAYSYFWTEAQVRSGAEDPLWASMIYDVMFSTCRDKGDFSNAMQVVSNLCSTLHACGRFGRLAEVMAAWEQGQKMAGNRMNISSYPDMGAAIPCLKEIRHRDMPITQPSQRQIPAGSNASGFHVGDAGAFMDYASLQYSAGRWQDAMEYMVWIRDWATDKKSKQVIGEFATSWYAATSNIISSLEYMGFQDEALVMVEEGLAAPHGQTYHGRWKIFLQADHLHSLMQLGRPPSDMIAQYESLIEKASHNGHINKSGVWSIKNQLSEALIHTGRAKDGEALYDQLVTEGSLTARRARLTHWIKSGRTHGVEDELKDLLRFSRETAQKMNEYGLYRDYAEFLENAGRQREALLMRREVLRLAKAFGLFTHLPVEQSKLALLLLRLGDKSGSAEMAELVRSQVKQGRLPKSILAEIESHLAKLGNAVATTAATQPEKQHVDLQPQKSMVIPIADLPWTSYLTLTNPGNQVKAGHLQIKGPAVECSINKETDDITIQLLDSKPNPAPTEFACSVDPGTYRLIHLQAGAEAKATGDLQISWKDADSSSNATVTLETPESGVNGAIIQAGDYRANPFYGVPMFFQYASKDEATDSPPLRFRSSHVSRIEAYQLDGTPLAIDAQGNGSLLNKGDELFVKSDGSGNAVLPLAQGKTTINLMLYPANGIPDEGLTIDIEAFTDGAWQLYSRNRLAK